jgi:hypothetical protein
MWAATVSQPTLIVAFLPYKAFYQKSASRGSKEIFVVIPDF